MKAIQTFWTNGSIRQLEDLNGGWLNVEYHLLSWCLSCLLLKRQFKHLELITDGVGNELLIDKLGLPYDSVLNVMDDKKAANPKGIWVTNKLHAYHLQDEPFLHFDSDVFLWKRLNANLKAARLVSQNVEMSFVFYKSVAREMKEKYANVPRYILSGFSDAREIRAANAGVVGGCNYSFYKDYCREVASFIEDNASFIDQFPDKGSMNMFLEQYFLFHFAKSRKIKMTYVLKSKYSDCMYPGLADFSACDLNRNGFIHMMGSYKKSIYLCKQLMLKVKADFPEYYYRVLDLVQELRTTYATAQPGPHAKYGIPEQLRPKIKSFNTTRNILKLCSVAESSIKFGSEVQFTSSLLEQSSVSKQGSEPYKHLLTDSYVFESQKRKILARVLSALPAYREEEQSREACYTDIFEKYFDANQKVRLKKDIFLVQSSWDWVNDSVEKNAGQPGDQHFCLLIFDFRNKLYQQYVLDYLNVLILYNLRKPLTVGGLVGEIKKRIEDGNQGDDLYLERSIYAHLKDLYICRAIEVN